VNPTKPCTCLFLVLHVPFSFAVFVVVNEMVIRCNVMTFFKEYTCENNLVNNKCLHVTVTRILPLSLLVVML